MTEIIRLTNDNFSDTIQQAKEVVEAGGILIYPTDTLYGIGGNAMSMDVVGKINDIKKVKEFKPMSVIMSDIPMIKEYCEMESWQEAILKEYLPGPYTFLLKLHRPMAVTNNLKLGVRIPNTTFCHELSGACRKPIVTTSANITTEEPPYTFDDISRKVMEKADIAIDEGVTRHKYHSSVVDLVDKKIIRKGGQETVDLSKILDI
ncbi:MAG: L-threonylcarbamoyladenylate synthase [Candidatus Micrarchaeota archaeon]